MFGIGLLAILAAGGITLAWATSRLRNRKLKFVFLLLVILVLASCPFAYKASTSFANFQALCEAPDRYRVVQTKKVDYLYLDRDEGVKCDAGPTLIGALPYAGFDCEGITSKTTTEPFRYTKKPDWRESCGLECFELSTGIKPEINLKRSYRQGYITGAEQTVKYGYGRANTPDDEKLRFFDTVILDSDTEMAYVRSYTYYPYGSGWATLLGAASGNAPSMRCKNHDMRWSVLDVYKPRAGS